MATTCGIQSNGSVWDALWSGDYTRLIEDIDSPDSNVTKIGHPNTGIKFRVKINDLDEIPQLVTKINIRVYAYLYPYVYISGSATFGWYTVAYLINDVEICSFTPTVTTSGAQYVTHTQSGLNVEVSSGDTHELEFTSYLQGSIVSIDTVYPCITYRTEKNIEASTCTEKVIDSSTCTEKVVPFTP